MLPPFVIIRNEGHITGRLLRRPQHHNGADPWPTFSPARTYAGLGSGALLVEIAKNDHIAFKRRVLDGVLGRTDLKADGVPDHHGCRLGKWYDAITDQSVLGNSAYTCLVNPHQQVHAAAKAALTHAGEGRVKEAFDALEEMNKASVSVVTMLENLAAELNAMEETRLLAAG